MRNTFYLNDYSQLPSSLMDTIENTIDVPNSNSPPVQDIHGIFPFDDAIFLTN